MSYLVWPTLQLAADAGSIDLTVFAQYGVLGIIAALLIFFARGAHQRERDRADRLEEETKRLNALILDRVIPALMSATHAAEESTQLLHAFQREREFTQAAAVRASSPKGGTS